METTLPADLQESEDIGVLHSAAAKVAQMRTIGSAYATLIKSYEEELAKTPTGQLLATTLMEQVNNGQALSAAEKELRQLAEAHYAKWGKLPPSTGVSIGNRTVLQIDDAALATWARQNPVAALDAGILAVQKGRAGEFANAKLKELGASALARFPWFTQGKVTAATISSKLAQILAGVVD